MSDQTKWQELLDLADSNDQRRAALSRKGVDALPGGQVLLIRLEKMLDELLGPAIAGNAKRVKFELDFQRTMAEQLFAAEEALRKRQRTPQPPPKRRLYVPGGG